MESRFNILFRPDTSGEAKAPKYSTNVASITPFIWSGLGDRLITFHIPSGNSTDVSSDTFFFSESVGQEW